MILMTAMIASLTACGTTSEAAEADYIYGQIDSISGNDVVLLLADYNENAESDTAENKESDSEDGEKKRSFSKPADGEMPEGFDPSSFSGEKPERSGDSEDGEKKRSFSKPADGEMPEGFDPSSFSGEKPERSGDSEDGEKKKSFSRPADGEMPEGFDPSSLGGEMPEGFDPGSFSGEMPEGFSRSGGSGKSGRSSKNSKYTLTGEQEELRIPVGTTVTTSLGVKTDFDALKAGDIIKCSVEKDSEGNDVVTEVWVMEQ